MFSRGTLKGSNKKISAGRETEPETGRLVDVRMIPTRMGRFRVNRAAGAEVAWLAEILNREGKRFGTSVEPDRDDTLDLRWR